MAHNSEFEEELASIYGQMVSPAPSPVAESNSAPENPPVVESSVGPQTETQTEDLNSAFQEALRGLSIMEAADDLTFSSDALPGDTDMDLSDPDNDGDVDLDEGEEQNLEDLVYQLKSVADQLYDILVGGDEDESADGEDFDEPVADDLGNVRQESVKTLGVPLRSQKLPKGLVGKNNKVPGKLSKTQAGKAPLIKYQKGAPKVTPAGKRGMNLAAKKSQKVPCKTDNIFGV